MSRGSQGETTWKRDSLGLRIAVFPLPLPFLIAEIISNLLYFVFLVSEDIPSRWMDPKRRSAYLRRRRSNARTRTPTKLGIQWTIKTRQRRSREEEISPRPCPHAYMDIAGHEDFKKKSSHRALTMPRHGKAF